MPIKFDEIIKIDKLLENYPLSKLQIVTKNRQREIVKKLIQSGYCFFGENKVQEAKEKFNDIDVSNINLHLIGPLQTNKVKDALKIFDVIQTIDRARLVEEITKHFHKESTKTKNFYIQVNIGNEPQKSGVLPESLSDLYSLCIDKSMPIEGLMCIPPINQPSEYYFNKMKSLRDNLNSKLRLSMGMSDDYEVALKNGSNIIRVGSRLFNE